MKEWNLDSKKAFVCDLDGTLFMGPNPIESAVDFVCVLSGETTREDLAAYEGKMPAIVVDTFDKVDGK